MTVIWWTLIVLVALGILLSPLLVYFWTKMSTLGRLRGQERYKQLQKRKGSYNGDESRT